MVRLLRAAAVPVMLVVLIALSGVVLGRIYADALLTQLVAGAAVLSVGASVAARRLPSWAPAPISVLLLAGYALLALWIAAGRAALTGPLPTIAADALANGIPRLLTALIPVESTPDTIIVPVVAAWLAGLAAAEIAVRGGRVLLACLPPVALYAGALYVVGPNADTTGSASLAFAGCVVAALATSKGTNRHTVPAAARKLVRWRTLGAATAGLITVVGLIALAGPWVSDRVSATPVDPRRYVEPPQVDSLDESPLNRISGWALTPSQRLFTVAVNGRPLPATPTASGPRASGAPPRPATGSAPAKTPAAPAGAPVASGASRPPGAAPAGPAATQRLRLRLAVLPDYDGVTWRVGATYRNAGRVLPSPPALADATTEDVRQDITVDGLTGRLLPAVPTPSTVEGARVAYDPGSGTLIRPEGLQPGLQYTVESARQTPDLNLLPTADSPSGDAVARFLAVGADVPEPIQALSEQLADGNGAAFDRAVAIEEFLAEHYRLVPDAPSGHAYPNLSWFLFGPRTQGGQVGTSEQFAASYALLARLTGLPSRVVVGFDAPAAGGTVTAANALAWPEVLFDGLGWVAFDPLPKSDDPRPVEEDFTPKPSTPPSDPSEAPPPSDNATTSAPPAILAEGDEGIPAAFVAGGASGTVFLLLAGVAVSVLLMRRGLRRRRLTTGAPDDRITGAWLEFSDALRLAGHPVPPHLAATEAAAHAADPPRLRKAAPAPEDDALPPLDALVTSINTTAFAPGAADDEQARRAAEQAITYADDLRRRRSWWRRLWWSLHPGPLRWHR